MPSKRSKKKTLGEYQCPECQRSWVSATSSINCAVKCNNCNIDVLPCKQSTVSTGKTPYQGEKRTFGHFKCPECQKQWTSANSWANYGQKCIDCNIYVYPYRQVPLKRPTEKTELDKPHLQDLCEKCNDLGRLCRSRAAAGEGEKCGPGRRRRQRRRRR